MSDGFTRPKSRSHASQVVLRSRSSGARSFRSARYCAKSCATVIPLRIKSGAGNATALRHWRSWLQGTGLEPPTCG